MSFFQLLASRLTGHFQLGSQPPTPFSVADLSVRVFTAANEFDLFNQRNERDSSQPNYTGLLNDISI